MRRIGILVAITSSALLAVASAWGGSGSRQVQMLDDCEPTSFNAALMDPEACVKDGGTTFDEFIGQLLSQGSAPAWRFAPTQVKLQAGATITANNRGGEFHTFTEVAAFGGGCIQVLNDLLGLTPVPECAAFPAIFGTTGAPPGGSVTTVALGPGIHRFECLIHPWMRATVSVS
jgi:plastocyanin